MTAVFPTQRLRRLRHHPVLRNLVRETELQIHDLILPLFIKGTAGEKKPVSSMPGHFQIPLECLEAEISEIVSLGLSTVLLFGVPDYKDPLGKDSYDDQGITQRAIRKIKEVAPDLLVISDLCLCEYTDHGHCGVIVDRQGKWHIDNDQTLDLLVKQAISHAKSGADMMAPSGMMDGAVLAIRRGLDQAGFNHIPIFNYSVKYNSCLYGPFRHATEGAPKHGDRSTHQMDPSNAKEAIRQVLQDVTQGADLLMVKPAHAYLDIIYRVKEAYPHIPLGAYHTSGEFCMIKAASEKGWLDERKTVYEILKGIRRAGADFIITYYAKEWASWEKGLS